MSDIINIMDREPTTMFSSVRIFSQPFIPRKTWHNNGPSMHDLSFSEAGALVAYPKDQRASFDYACSRKESFTSWVRQSDISHPTRFSHGLSETLAIHELHAWGRPQSLLNFWIKQRDSNE